MVDFHWSLTIAKNPINFYLYILNKMSGRKQLTSQLNYSTFTNPPHPAAYMLFTLKLKEEPTFQAHMKASAALLHYSIKSDFSYYVI